MNDYLVELKIKNNLLSSKMKELGIVSAAELGRLSNLSNTEVGFCLNLKHSLYTHNGTQIRAAYIKLSSFFRCLPEDLIPENMWFCGLDTNKSSAEMSHDDLLSITNPNDSFNIESKIENLDLTTKLLNHLENYHPNNPESGKRRRKVVEMRIDGATLYDVGLELNVGGQRARQMESEAYRIMNKYARSLDSEGG